jgi:hypothetical protein
MRRRNDGTPAYKPAPGDIVTFKHRLLGRLQTSVGWITGINSDRTFEIHVQSGFHYSNVLRRHVIEKVGDRVRRRKE